MLCALLLLCYYTFLTFILGSSVPSMCCTCARDSLDFHVNLEYFMITHVISYLFSPLRDRWRRGSWSWKPAEAFPAPLPTGEWQYKDHVCVWSVSSYFLSGNEGIKVSYSAANVVSQTDVRSSLSLIDVSKLCRHCWPFQERAGESKNGGSYHWTKCQDGIKGPVLRK